MTGVRERLAAAGSHEGRQRDQNEDRWLADPARGIFCVVDGVGGHPGGERAAEIAVDMLRARLGRETGSPAERLREAITLANNAIFDTARETPALAGMTCVLTAALVSGNVVTAGHVGDTRLYKLRGGRLRKLTRDHSPVGEREDAGELTEAEAMRHGRRNEVYRDVGAEAHAPEDADFVEVVEAPFEEDAALLICSDGLTDQVPSPMLVQLIETHAGRPAAAVDALIAAANDAGGKDNVTVVVVEGERFAAAARARAGDGAREVQNGGRPVRRARLNPWTMLALGLILGAAMGVAGWRYGPSWWPRVEVTAPPDIAPAAPRTWRVGLTADADTATIADAVARASAGDTIVIGAGDYREAVTIGVPLTLEAAAGAILRPPLGAAPAWIAVRVADARGVRLSGLTIAGGEDHALAYGVWVARGEVVVVDLRVSGAVEAGLALGDGARATVSASTFTDNPGAAILVRRGASLDLRHSFIARNGVSAARPHPAIELDREADVSLTGNAVGGNAGAAIGGWPADRIAAFASDNLLLPAPRTEPRRPATPARPARGTAGR